LHEALSNYDEFDGDASDYQPEDEMYYYRVYGLVRNTFASTPEQIEEYIDSVGTLITSVSSDFQ
jgi:hypothetical protein